MDGIKKDVLGYAGKTVVITGAAQGAGAGIAKRFAEIGANVVITYRTNKDAGLKKVEEFKALGVKAAAYELDQRKVETIDGVVEQIVKDFGTIDVLVNNAGIYPHAVNMDMTVEDWDDMLDTNTRGMFFVSRSVAKVMAGQKDGGAIVNISSINATFPSDTLTHYGISKAADEMMTRCLAHDFGKLGVRVNCVAPGLIENPMLDVYVPGWRESYCERAALGKLVEPEDIGDACIFLGSVLAKSVTGQVLTVDSGIELAPLYKWD